MTSYRLTPHLLQKAEREGVALSLIWDIILNPGLTYASYDSKKGRKVPYTCRKCHQPQQKWTGTASNGQKFCVVVNPCCGDAITFWPDQIETELRPDQRASGVNRFRGRDGKWRA